MKKGKVDIEKHLAQYMKCLANDSGILFYLDSMNIPYKEPGFDFKIVTTPTHVELQWVVKQTYIPGDIENFLKGMIW